MKLVSGSDLPVNLKSEARARFIYRHTGDHKPDWATRPMPNGDLPPVQFVDDADWLANTKFWITAAGKFSSRHRFCESSPTWPTRPDLRLPKFGPGLAELNIEINLSSHQ